jgi:glycosyltransferase involved in cell wall biosynthesis
MSCRISVVIPCYNAADWLADCIRSVLQQDAAVVEIVLVDDGSTDQSCDIARQFSKVRVLRQGNRGANAARNYGASESKGEFILFLDADDMLGAGALGVMLSVAAQNRGYLVHGDYADLYWRDHEWIPRQPSQPREPTGDPAAAWLEGWFAPTCGLLWPRDVYEATGGWDEELTANQDGDIVLRALLAGIGLIRAEGAVCYYRHQQSARTASAARTERSLASRMRVLQKVESSLASEERHEQYKLPLGRAYYRLARAYAVDQPVLAVQCEREAWRLAGSDAATGTRLHRAAAYLLGLMRKERLARAVIPRRRVS